MFWPPLSRTVGAHMIELQVLAALLAFERARERVLGEARRVGARPAVAVLGGVTIGWIVGSTGRRAS
jgi:hypothetical protein